ncbi:MAG TPA: PIN domain-containing protein [Candidatus Saccharimonadales bacterium]|nr:PIN domain-containing protein [Candidatus Saccharimonadales bacterium]
MANVYLDTNIFVDIIEERNNINFESFWEHKLFTSPLSLHILIYTYKYRVPNKKLHESHGYLTFIPFDSKIVQDALLGPTTDFEDNVQLHSAVKEDCEIFLTRDKELLNMKFFGKMKIVKEIE